MIAAVWTEWGESNGRGGGIRLPLENGGGRWDVAGQVSRIVKWFVLDMLRHERWPIG